MPPDPPLRDHLRRSIITIRLLRNFCQLLKKLGTTLEANCGYSFPSIFTNKKTIFVLSLTHDFLRLATYLAPVVQKLNSAIHRINLYPVDKAVGFPGTYPLDSDLSSG